LVRFGEGAIDELGVIAGLDPAIPLRDALPT
jgi:hypothetical protein